MPDLRALAYEIYARRLQARLRRSGLLPRHVGIVMDGNRRWARSEGYSNPSEGHRAGAEHLHTALRWCEELGICNLTNFVASTDNLQRRESAEIDYLMRRVEDIVARQLALGTSPWQVHIAGSVDVLPDSTARALKRAVEATADRGAGLHLNVAVGYDGREEIVDAVRSLLGDAAQDGLSIDQAAGVVTTDAIDRHVYTRDQPEPDFLIRTSGERRLSGFLLWQPAEADLYFCDIYWPAFRKVDFLRALRTFARRRASPGRHRNRAQ